MGKCKICERETLNNYSYYRAIYSGTMYWSDGNYNYSQAGEVTNKVLHNDFVCTRCVKRKWAILCTIFAAFWLLIAVLITISRIEGNPTASIGLIIFFYAFAFFWGYLVYVNIKKIRNDEKVSISDAIQAIQKKAKVIKDEVYFPAK